MLYGFRTLASYIFGGNERNDIVVQLEGWD